MTEETTHNQKVQEAAERPQPAINLPLVVWLLLAALLAEHVAWWTLGPSYQAWAEYNFAFIPARLGTQPFPQPPGAAWWSFLTYGFLHADWTHVASNSLWLAIFSKPVQMRLGSLRYIMLLGISVVAGACAGMMVHWGQPIIMVGMSAGVSGVLAACIPLMHGRFDFASDRVRHVRPLKPFDILTHPQSLTFTVMWLALTVVTASSQYLTGTAFLEERVIAWEAHLGGFIAGLISFYLLDRGKVHEHH